MYPSFPYGWDSCENPYTCFPPGVSWPAGCTDTREFLKLHARLEVLGIGVWIRQQGYVKTFTGWHRLFGIPDDDLFLKKDYLSLIDDPGERERVKKFLDGIHRYPPDTRWADTFTLAKKRIHSRAFVMENETLFGVDILV